MITGALLYIQLKNDTDGVASSCFHRPYVDFTYIDNCEALLLAHSNIIITDMNAWLLFECSSYFLELVKRVATIRGRLLFKVWLLFK